MNTPDEMVKEAVSRGFVSLGFSCHSPLPYTTDWALKYERIDEYCQAIAGLKEEYKDSIEVICGIELDVESIDIPIEKFAYVLGSMHTLRHQGVAIPVDTSLEEWCDGVERCFGGNMISAISEYYSQVYLSAIRPEIDIVGHFDLVTKFNEGNILFDENGKEYLDIAISAIDGVCDKRPDVIFEINTGAMARAGRTVPYPTKPLLKRLCERGMRVMVNSDCHNRNYLEVGYEKAFGLLDECGFKSVWRLREFGFEELSLK
jgi:histidinol-phosphatase (PHP family)